jgi:hypothetical protein
MIQRFLLGMGGVTRSGAGMPNNEEVLSVRRVNGQFLQKPTNFRLKSLFSTEPRESLHSLDFLFNKEYRGESFDPDAQGPRSDQYQGNECFRWDPVRV